MVSPSLWLGRILGPLLASPVSLSTYFNFLNLTLFLYQVQRIMLTSQVFGRDRQASLVAQTVKKLHAMEETGVQSLGQEDALEKRMATHSSILAWRIPWTEEPGGHGVAKSQT